ncbi:Fic family protein [Allohahella sp. A8]|uniref:Fic family protein n=1 Tax=Allohahella sp. A8 TaxID=3141461 RepID=UPI003A805284
MISKLPINIDDLLHRRTVESERIEYKEGWNPESVLHTLCAFANDFHNLGGGYVVIGVEERNGQPQLPPVGLATTQIDAIQKELLNLGHSALAPHFHPLTATYEIQGNTILVLWAPGGEMRPYKAKVSLSSKKADWAYYLRKHTSTVRATGADERELVSLAATVPFDDRYRQTASLEDLSSLLMREFLQEIKSELAADARELDTEILGRRMNVVGGPVEMAFPKNVGLLFFNEHPEQFFPATQIDVVYFPDGPGGDRFEEKEFRGPLGRITRDALNYIVRSYLKEAVIKHPSRPEAERFWNFPLGAIEEALVNAVYHRSYEIREPIEVRISPEELVVLSFPGPDRSIRMEDLQAGRAVSRRYRNRRIGEFLKELDLTEGRSTGVPKILRAMKTNGSPTPVFDTDEDRSYFLIRLPVHVGFDRDELPNQLGAEQVAEQVTEQVQRLLQALTEEPLSTKSLLEILSLNHRPTFLQNYLQPALAAHVVEMTQPDSPRSPTQKYRLTDSGRKILALKE